MCGLTGFIDFKNSSSQRIIDNMTNALVHRGPDGFGSDFFQERNFQIGLGHRRLSILDLSALGRQPMYAFDQRYAILLNGEVYNFIAIRNELKEKGHRFISDSDTEVLLHAFIEWGQRAAQKFIGMFAIAFLDRKDQKLLLVRDRVGVKPLYYVHSSDKILFASELRAFHLHPSFKKEIDLNALSDFLDFGYIKKPKSIFKGVQSVLPGQMIEFDLSTSTSKPNTYWSALDCYNVAANEISFEDATDEVERLLIDAFKYRMVSDVPVGVFLSGGVDSTLVAGMLQKHHTSQISTFTIGFESKEYNEADIAARIAKHLGTNHHELYCSERELLDIFPQLPTIYDEPFADKSAIPTVLVSRLARQHVTVALSADGGDEIFAGYDKYVKVLKIKEQLANQSKLKGSLYKNAYELFSATLGYSSKYTAKSYAESKYLRAFPDPVEMMIEGSRVFGERELSSMINHDFGSELNERRDVRRDDLTRMQAYDFTDYLPDDIMVKLDRASMSIGLEGREPLLDHRILELVASLPAEFKYSNGVRKHLLREVNARYIPKALLQKGKKGFGIPKKEWLEKELQEFVHHYLSPEFIHKQGVFSEKYMRKLNEAFNKRLEHNKIWNLLIFNMWYERWMK